jgi:hypothetical protein
VEEVRLTEAVEHSNNLREVPADTVNSLLSSNSREVTVNSLNKVKDSTDKLPVFPAVGESLLTPSPLPFYPQ